jgi:monoterpene epsilon-lactone hydrolase
LTSLKSLLLKATLKTISPIIVNAGLEVQRSRQDFLGTLKKKPEGVVSEQAELGSIKAEWFYREEACDLPVILYFHGGAYVTGSLLSSRVLASELAFETGFRVLSFEYRLAPEHPYPAALEDALDVYGHLLSCGVDPEDIVFAGESAGGGLLLCTALALKDRGMPLPSALVCLSPWTDLEMKGESIEINAKSDPLLTHEYLKSSAAMYAGGQSLALPYISPVNGDFSGLPDVLIHAGSDEILLDDARLLRERLAGCGVKADLKVFEDMWHVWHIFDIPEAHEALAGIGDFIRQRRCGGIEPR